MRVLPTPGRTRRVLVVPTVALAAAALAFSAGSAHAAWQLPSTTLQVTADVRGAQVAAGASGRYAVAWTEDTGTSRIRFRRIEADGEAGPNLILSDIADGNADDVHVASDAAGDAIVAWRRNAPELQVQARRIPAGGAPSPAVALSDGATRPWGTPSPPRTRRTTTTSRSVKLVGRAG
jgi:hypothetical protein